MFEAMALVGGFWFFLFMIFVLAIGILSAEEDSLFGGAITLVGLALGSQLLFDIPVFETVIANPLWIVLGLIAYIFIGITYSTLYRYSNWLKDRSECIQNDFNRFRKEYKKEHDNEEPSNKEFRDSSFYYAYRPSSNVNVITAWTALWPWALFWDLCHRPIRCVYNNLYSFVGRILERVGAKVTDNIIDKGK